MSAVATASRAGAAGGPTTSSLLQETVDQSADKDDNCWSGSLLPLPDANRFSAGILLLSALRHAVGAFESSLRCGKRPLGGAIASKPQRDLYFRASRQPSGAAGSVSSSVVLSNAGAMTWAGWPEPQDSPEKTKCLEFLPLPVGERRPWASCVDAAERA